SGTLAKRNVGAKRKAERLSQTGPIPKTGISNRGSPVKEHRHLIPSLNRAWSTGWKGHGHIPGWCVVTGSGGYPARPLQQSVAIDDGETGARLYRRLEHGRRSGNWGRGREVVSLQGETVGLSD